MASISTSKTDGTRRILFTGANGRKIIHLGKMPMKAVREIKTKVEALNVAGMAKISIDKETAEWVGKLDARLYDRLAAVGLVPTRETKPQAAVTSLGPFIDAYIELRADLKPNTKDHLKRARRNLVEFFGEAKPLSQITSGDADEFRLHLAKTMDANSTVPRICGRAKQFFRYAVRKKLLAESPFGDMKGTAVKANKDREFFVTRKMAALVLQACPDNEWRLLFALSRYGGLRCPSEHLALRWGDMDWERGRIHVQSPKTAHHEGKESRWVPMFPELRPILAAAFEAAEPGTEYVITRYRDKNANLRTQFNRIVRKAGLEPWQKPFQNLRSTRETELAETYPIHVVCSWIGNSEAVANKHYLQVTDEHFDRAQKVTQNPTHKGAKLGKTKGHQGKGDLNNRRENPAFPEIDAADSSPGRGRIAIRK